MVVVVVVVGDLVRLVVIGVDGVVGDSVVPPRTAPALPLLPKDKRLRRSRSILSREGVGEFL